LAAYSQQIDDASPYRLSSVNYDRDIWTNCLLWLLIVQAPSNSQSKEVEYSGYMPGQAVQVISFNCLLQPTPSDVKVCILLRESCAQISSDSTSYCRYQGGFDLNQVL